MRRRQKLPINAPLGEEALLRRAWRHRRRGEQRRAMLVLREACQREAGSAKLWTLYAAQCVRVGRRDEAQHALKQALWLRQRARDAVRVRVVGALIDQLRTSAGTTLRLAAA